MINREELIEQIKQMLIQDEDCSSWEEFVNLQQLGDCQYIVSSIKTSFKNNPRIKSIFGEIEIDNPYIDENGNEQNFITHHWITIDGQIEEFSKGTLISYIDWNDIYSVDPEDESRYDIGYVKESNIIKFCDVDNELLQEIKATEVLRKSADKRAPIAKTYQIKARFVGIDIDAEKLFWATQDFGPHGSRRTHTTTIQLNGRKDKVKWDQRFKLLDVYENNESAFVVFARKWFAKDFMGNGEINFGCSCECLVPETLIKMLDGTIKRIDELIPGEKYWIYSSDENGNFIPKQATALGVTKTVNQIVEVTLDNGKIEKCSLNHLWRLRDGSYKKACELQSGDSLMPLYNEFDDKGYEIIYDNDGKKKFTHSVVNKIENRIEHEKKLQWLNEVEEYYLVTHHKDANKVNNLPENLQWMGNKEHFEHHAKEGTQRLSKTWNYWSNPEYYDAHVEIMRENGRKNNFKTNPEVQKKAIEALRNDEEAKKILSENLKERWNSEGFREKVVNTQKVEIKKKWDDPNFVEAHKRGREKDKARLIKYCKSDKNKQRTISINKDPEMKRKQLIGRLFKVYDNIIKSGLDINDETFKRFRKANTPYPNTAFTSLEESLEFYKKRNHKVVSVKIIDVEPTPLYDLFVPDTHNFALASGVYVHNSFLYGGFMEFATRDENNLTDADLQPETDYYEERRPVRNNPNEYGVCCKHVAGLIMQIQKFLHYIIDAAEDALEYYEQNPQKAPKAPPSHTPIKSPTQRRTPVKTPVRQPQTPVKQPVAPVTAPTAVQQPKRPTGTSTGRFKPIQPRNKKHHEQTVGGNVKTKFHKQSEKKSPWIVLNVDLNNFDVDQWVNDLNDYAEGKHKKDHHRKHHHNKKMMKKIEKSENSNQIKLLQDEEDESD